MPSAPRQSSLDSHVVVIGFAALATLALLMPAQNDTWWHLRSGREMIASHALLFRDTFSSTAYGHFFWNHSWLSQIVFYALYALGGLPSLTLACAIVVVLAWTIVWRLMRGPTVDRLLFMAAAVAAGTVTWSLRPQVFSLLFVPLTLWLIVRDRWVWLPSLFALWANLHAGFALGIVIAAAGVAVTALDARPRFAARAVWFAATVAATLLTPLGVRNWIEIAASMRRSSANAIQEWLPTALPPQNLLFWALLLLVGILAIVRWRQLASPGDRLLVIAAVMTGVLAARSFRNVTPFTMLAAIAASRLVWPHDERETPSPGPVAFTPAMGLWMMATALVVTSAWSVPWPTLGWRPVSAPAAAAIASCPSPIYNTYEGGGPIIWFAPTQRVFLDSRQDPYPPALVQEASEVERTGHFQPLFARFHFGCAALPPNSPTAAALRRDGWLASYADAQWVVLTPGQASSSDK